MKQSAKNKLTLSSGLSVAWPPFAQKLAATLESLEEDQYLILSVKRTNRFVQFAAQGAFGVRVETTSNSYLAKHEQLDAKQIANLVKLGWHEPTGSPSNSTPEGDPDGSPNFFAEFQAPVSFEAVANLTVHTLAETLRVPHPGFLQYEAFDMEGEAIALPELGLKLAKRVPESDSQADLSQLLLATLSEMTGISDLNFDDDGDIGIRYGSAVTFVRLNNDLPYVRIYSPILSDVEESSEIFTRLNDINVNETLMRFFFRNGVIYGVADISAVPFVSAHVTQAFKHFCTIADGMDDLLQEEFGGRTAFAEPMPSLMKH